MKTADILFETHTIDDPSYYIFILFYARGFLLENFLVTTQQHTPFFFPSTGPWRGANRKCYHNWCDDVSQLTSKNLNFLKNTIDTLANVLSRNIPKVNPTTTTGSVPDPQVPPFSSEPSDMDERSFFFPPMNFPPTSFANVPSQVPGRRSGRGQPPIFSTTTRSPFITPRNWWKLPSNF